MDTTTYIRPKNVIVAACLALLVLPAGLGGPLQAVAIGADGAGTGSTGGAQTGGGACTINTVQSEQDEGSCTFTCKGNGLLAIKGDTVDGDARFDADHTYAKCNDKPGEKASCGGGSHCEGYAQTTGGAGQCNADVDEFWDDGFTLTCSFAPTGGSGTAASTAVAPTSSATLIGNADGTVTGLVCHAGACWEVQPSVSLLDGHRVYSIG